MGEMLQKMKRTENFRDYIDKILKNQEIDNGDQWWDSKEAWGRLQALAEAKGNYVTDSTELNIEGSERLIAAVFREDPEKIFEEIMERVEKLAAGEDTSGIRILFFAEDMERRICLERTFGRQAMKDLRARARKCSGSKKFWIRCTYILLKTYDSQEVKLKGLRRHEMVQMPPIRGKINQEGMVEAEDGGEKVNALVFTIDLYQLAKLYNLIGDRLFKNNVRFGISETLGVNDSIRRTLGTEPELFWFKNNGVTILVEDPDFIPRNVEELKLGEIGPEKEPDFSVVNGAQTITVAAEYFFNMEYNWKNSKEGSAEKSEFLDKLNRSKKAEVLLRIIKISKSEEGAGVSEMAKEISVALNRQKPIKMEDIAFTLPFVEKMARFLGHMDPASPGRFVLVRRGEESNASQEMDLVEFARARLACMGHPGEARSQGSGTLLKIQVEEGAEDTFQRKDIFVPEWQEADEADEPGIFRRHYGALWFAHEAAREYDRKRQMAVKGEKSDVAAALNNGKWYFAAILVQIFNGLAMDSGNRGRELYDYSKFTASFSYVRGKIPEAMKCFARIVVLYAEGKEEYRELNSNLFKRNELYLGVMEEIRRVYASPLLGDSESELDSEIGKLAELFPMTGAALAQTEAAASIAGMEEYERLSEADEEAQGVIDDGQETDLGETEEGGKKTAVKMDFLILNGKKIICKSFAKAQADTVSYILGNYEMTEEQLEVSKDWITSQKEKGESKEKYFRNVKKIRVNGQDYWIGTSTNSGLKYSQVKALCKEAQVGKNEIFWYADSLESPVFSW